jgi:Holliday junction DNA helicase RuvA
VTVEVGGVGFAVLVPTRSAAHLPEPGREVFLHTHLQVRENAFDLYGFSTPGERSIFQAFLAVSGVGPRTALAVLSVLSVEDIAAALHARDVDAFCRVPGVGKKTAQRVILELSERPEIGSMMSSSGPRDDASQATLDAEQALVTLGYSEAQARKSVGDARGRLGSTAASASLIREALSGLSGAR